MQIAFVRVEEQDFKVLASLKKLSLGECIYLGEDLSKTRKILFVFRSLFRIENIFKNWPARVCAQIV